MNTHHCILCGSSSIELMHYPTADLLGMIHGRMKPGPVAYQAVTSWTSAAAPTCKQCLHQLRRHRPSARCKQMLPLDTSIIQIIVPGVMRQQDTRTTARMLKALTDPGNRYYRVFEALDPLLCEQKLTAWWEYNLRTEFYAHKTTARLMRLSGLSTPGTG